MILILQIAAIILFFSLGAYAFYHAFKRYKSAETFYEDVAGGSELFLIEIFIGALLWITKKLFPESIHLKVYRILAFLYGLLMITFAIFMTIDLLE